MTLEGGATMIFLIVLKEAKAKYIQFENTKFILYHKSPGNRRNILFDKIFGCNRN